MEDNLLKILVQEGVTPTFVAILYYFAYKYLTGQLDKRDKKIEEKDAVIMELINMHSKRIDVKDTIILELSNKQTELVKMVVENSITLREEIKDSINIAVNIEGRTDQILKKINEIKSFIPKT